MAASMSANAPALGQTSCILRVRSLFAVAQLGYRGAMVGLALRATSHVAAWIVWQSLRISLLDDLEVPRPPAEELATRAA
jgi:hypothetical protein